MHFKWLARIPAPTTAIWLLLIAGQTQAEFITGNEIFDDCENGHEVCGVYVMGVVDAFGVVSNEGKTLPIMSDEDQVIEIKTFCMAERVTGSQLAGVFLKYLQGNPENRHWNAAILVHNSLLEKFPCGATEF